jgi:hypothetical protein
MLKIRVIAFSIIQSSVTPSHNTWGWSSYSGVFGDRFGQAKGKYENLSRNFFTCQLLSFAEITLVE